MPTRSGIASPAVELVRSTAAGEQAEEIWKFEGCKGYAFIRRAEPE